jgi:hypothetical protein
MRIPTQAGFALAAAMVAASIAPAAASISHGPATNSPAFQMGIVPHMILRSELGKYNHPSAVRPSVAFAAQKFAKTHHVDLRGLTKGYRPNASAVGVITDDYGYIWIMNTKFTVINSYLTDCSGAEGAKVDHNKNLWVACTNTGTVNEYAPGATSATMVLYDNPGGATYYTADVATDHNGNVYASSLYSFYCTTYYCYFYPGHVDYWTNPTNGASPTGTVNDPNINEEGFFLDSDNAGTNVYVDYESCGTTTCGFALDQITNPTSATPTVTTQLGYGSIQFPGGVYVAHSGNVLVNDQDTHLITEYQPSPWTALGQLGPLPLNIFGSGDAVAGGPNKKETMLALGDASLHAADVGKVSTNSWTAKPNINFGLPIGGAFSPSDK